MPKAEGEKKEKVGFGKKFVLFFKNLGVKIWRALREMYAELKKVSWPTKSELINYTLVVIGFMLAMGVVIYLIDLGAAALIQLIT